jgi:type VI secretion system secreted protein VgrG
VIGNLYNGKDVPPVALPANKHLSMLRSQGAGGAKTELVYDGTPGSERLLIQSGQNGLTLAASGITLHGPSVSISSTGDLVQRAGRALTVEAGGDLVVKSGQNTVMTSQKDAVLTVAGNTQLTSGIGLQTSVGANAQFTVGASLVLETGKDLSLKTGQNLLLQTARTARVTVGEDILLQAGRSLIGNAGAMFQFVAAQTGTLQTGEAFVLMKKDGTINLTGRDIAVKGSGDVTLKGSRILQN